MDFDRDLAHNEIIRLTSDKKLKNLIIYTTLICSNGLSNNRMNSGDFAKNPVDELLENPSKIPTIPNFFFISNQQKFKRKNENLDENSSGFRDYFAIIRASCRVFHKIWDCLK